MDPKRGNEEWDELKWDEGQTPNLPSLTSLSSPKSLYIGFCFLLPTVHLTKIMPDS